MQKSNANMPHDANFSDVCKYIVSNELKKVISKKDKYLTSVIIRKEKK
jgi:hypothetical protein